MTSERLGALASDMARALDELAQQDALPRMWRKDHTLWQDDPTEVADRLGWLDCPSDIAAKVAELASFADSVRADGFTDVLVLGMGGSSLFPEVLARAFPEVPGGLVITVLDTTDPGTIATAAATLPLAHTLIVASSKSGGTIETRSHLEHFWELIGDPRQFVVVTDPGSDLDTLATERGFRHVWRNDPDIGGRYSALSWFGLVPAALAGLDVEALLEGAERVAAANAPGTSAHAAPAARLAAAIGGAALAGHDKLTIVLPTHLAAFGLWLEQLVAESTGKHGRGALPVAGERLGAPPTYGKDRLFVALAPEPADAAALDALAGAGFPVVELDAEGAGESLLGAQVLLWELATALLGKVLGINPFDQPNVAEAKAATTSVLDGGPPEIELVEPGSLLTQVRPGDYVAIQAYVRSDDPGLADAIEALRDRIRVGLRVATTVGYGPRYLHSTGQFHKGGPPTGVFLQVVGPDPMDVDIPGRSFGFSTLKHAQADGDLLALQHHGLRAGRVELSDLLGVAAVKIGVVGLGRMGGNMAERLRQAGHQVVGYDLAPEGRDVATLDDLVAALDAPRAVWVMLPSGRPTDATIERLQGLLDAGDVIVNGANDNFRHDQELAQQLAGSGIEYIDAGVSGGVWGLTEGYALMVGGKPEQVARVQPVFDSLAPPGGFVHAGPVGAGHFTKMVHNGIEYAIMQAYGEGYELLQASELGIDVDGAFASWRYGSVVRSWLLDLAVRALADDPGLSKVRGWADDTGEGRWTVEEAVRLAVPLPAISASLFARFSSRQADSPTMKVVAALRGQFGGHLVHAEPEAEPSAPVPPS